MTRQHFHISDPIETFIRQLSVLFTSVRKFHFIVYSPGPDVQNRIHKGTSDSIYFGETKWAFERSLIDGVASGTNIDRVAMKLLQHDNEAERKNIESVDSDDLSNWFEKKRDSLKNDQAIGLVSTCETFNGEIAHLPLMDFSCNISDSNLEFITQSIHAIGVKRFVVATSGRSYHVYGRGLFNKTEWVEFMGKCLLLSPFTDTRYVAHRLISGRGILRITASRSKPVVPLICKIFGD